MHQHDANGLEIENDFFATNMEKLAVNSPRVSWKRLDCMNVVSAKIPGG